MLSRIPGILDAAQLEEFGTALEGAEWSDGRGSAGYLSQAVKRNEQLPDAHPTGVRLGERILRSLEHNAHFIAAALPAKIVPPLFNRYSGGQTYGAHIDGAIRPISGTPHRVRTDLSATIFLSRPDDYDGGELVIDDEFGSHSVKLEAGDMVLYPGTSVHQVMPVTRGVRYAAFFWVQSMVRDEAERKILFELDQSIQALGRASADRSELVRLAGVYHNLLRRWADV